MKKRFALLLCAIAAVLCLTACQKNDPPQTDPEATTAEMPLETETVAPPLTVIANGATEYRIVRPEDTSTQVLEAAMALHQAINQTYNIKMTLTTDFENRNFDISTRYPYEIVVGATNREETASAKELIRYNDTIIAVIGTRIVITGGSDDAVAAATEQFISKYVNGSELSLPQDLRDITSAEYTKSSVKLDGVNISEYTLVYATGFQNAAAAMADRIGDACGAIMKTATIKSEKSGREIIIGSADRGNLKMAGEYDSFTVTAQDGDLYITGGSITSIETGCAKLLETLLADGVESVALSDATLSYTRPAREEYIADINKIALAWELYLDTPQWMLDYDEKYAAMLDADGRLMSCLHRGEMTYYPENSIEGIISAIRMGADMVEIDPRRTKDGVLVLLHDATLTRTTDIADKAGKNGLPTSTKLEDWTYEQLMQLNLREGSGGNNTRVTAYKIPTLDEAFRVCANRIFIRLDVKADSNDVIFWDYERDIWPLMCKYESYTNVIYTWHAAFTNNNYALVKKFNAEQTKLAGRTAMHFIKASGSAQTILSLINSNSAVFTPTVRLTDFDLSKTSYRTYIANNSSKLSSLNGMVRIYVDAHGTNADYPENKEGKTLYDALNRAGINILLVNKGFDLCTYIAENFTPTSK